MINRMAALLLTLVTLLSAVGGVSASESGGLEGIATYRGKPVANATVSAAGRTVRTDATGRFKFSPIPVSDRVRLVVATISAEGLGKWSISEARIVAGDTLRLTAELERSEVNRRQAVPKFGSQRTASHPAGDDAVETAAGSNTTPPATIRVYVTGNHSCSVNAAGEVEVVDFKQYTKHVLPNEWLIGWPRESLRAGAMATKSYAWYQVNRGGKWKSLGADVMDSTCDQVYDPAVSYASTDQAVDDTWAYRVTRNGAVHVSFYRAGTRGDGVDYGNDIMYQWGTEYWASQGKAWPWILTHYYDNIAIEGATNGLLKVESGLTASASQVVWGRPFTASFTARNYGTEPTLLRELYVSLRGPGGQVADLGGDNDATPIPPGGSRTITRTVSAVGAGAGRVYGYYTLAATYRNAAGVIEPVLPGASASSVPSRRIELTQPTYIAETVSISNAAPRFEPGGFADVVVALRNTGGATWLRQPSAAYNAVLLATASPADRASRFYVPNDWSSSSRVSMVEASVKPGQVATFRIRFGGQVPEGAYTEAFQLVSESSSKALSVFGPTLTIQPTVSSDTVAPTSSIAVPAYSTNWSSDLTYPVRWAGWDSQSGVASYDVQWLDGYTWKPILTATTARAATFGASGVPTTTQAGKSYTVRVRATDRNLNVGAWSKPGRTTIPVDDQSLTYAGDWGSIQGSTYPHFMRTLHYTPTRGATATHKFYGRRAAWIGTMGPDKGRAEVWLDGKLAATVDLYSPTFLSRKVVYSKYFGPTIAWHSVEIRVLGRKHESSTGMRVDVDGVAVAR